MRRPRKLLPRGWVNSVGFWKGVERRGGRMAGDGQDKTGIRVPPPPVYLLVLLLSYS
jgi:hypothetical protein